MTLLSVKAEQAGRRLDTFVSSSLPELSRARVQRLIEEGHITVDGRSSRASTRIKKGDSVRVVVPPPRRPGRLEPQDIPLDVLYEDADILAVNKSAGLTVHPAPGNPDRTLVNALLHHISDLCGIGGELRPGIVHRLDKDTTGVMIIAKNERALTNLQSQFKARKVKKIYRALVHGVPKAEEGVIDRPIARHPRDRKRFSSRHAIRMPRAREARTSYRILEVFDGASLLEVGLETGRTHQIRVHLSEEGHPLLHDPVYGGARRDRTASQGGVRHAAALLGHHALHAARLEIEHPRSGIWMVFDAPPPPEWKQAIAALSGECGEKPQKAPPKPK